MINIHWTYYERLLLVKMADVFRRCPVILDAVPKATIEMNQCSLYQLGPWQADFEEICVLWNCLLSCIKPEAAISTTPQRMVCVGLLPRDTVFWRWRSKMVIDRVFCRKRSEVLFPKLWRLCYFSCCITLCAKPIVSCSTIASMIC